MHRKKIIIALLAVLMLGAIPMAQVIGHASIRAPAVILSNNTGSLTTISITVSKGNGTVTISGPKEVGNSTLQSAITAAQYASKFLSLNFSKYDFAYFISGAGQNVSGPSGGEAMTLLAISGLSGKRLVNNFTVTGTINSSGAVGLIGGAYDKSSAAKANGMSFILVPAAGSDTFESELYLLVQDTFNIPLIQVANTSQAYNYAFGISSIKGQQTTLNLYTNYNAGRLQQAPIQCSNSCNMSDFNELTNFTFGFANSSINTLAGSPGFANVSSQLASMLAQDQAIAAKGYLYAGADQAFIGYLTSFLFNSHSANESTGLYALDSIQQYCGSLSPPQLTRQNYEMVLAGELRQTWADYYINTSIATYNSSVETTDDVLEILKDYGAPANAWCSAAAEMYSIARSGSGASVTGSTSLAALASSRISRADPFGPSVYLQTAKEAYAVQNYPLAILDADYAYALSNSTQISANLTTGELLNFSNELAYNSTYGIWATQFSNEAEFYVAESGFAPNSSAARSYAISAFSSGYLSATLAPDMQTIYQSLVPGPSPEQVTPPPQSQINQTIAQETNSTAVLVLVEQTHQIFVVAVVMLVVNIVLFFMIVYLLLPSNKFSKTQLQGRKRPRSND